MIVTINDSEHSSGVSLEWMLDHFFAPLGDSALFNLVIIHAKPFATTVVDLLLLLLNPNLATSESTRTRPLHRPMEGGPPASHLQIRCLALTIAFRRLSMALRWLSSVLRRLRLASSLHLLLLTPSVLASRMVLAILITKKALVLLHLCFTLARLLSKIEKRGGMISPQQMIRPQMCLV
ncbi:hypothetical protein SLEP1_g90 [Rubroshorea leprosula]|uniref:Uncharacterized protein n=1 Tax=Rubroshorea leprosula TaxID=152421 RepID=A0AAV5HF07_9ROSI|nr:hypothetical protein SLEP1_g90 [Rubroshorea leprosula]